MATKLTEFWETYDRDHDSFMKEGMTLDDLNLRGKFNFTAFDRKWTAKTKSRFNFGAKGPQAAHEASVKGSFGKSNVEIKDKHHGESSVEANLDFGEKDNFTLGTYAYLNVNQNENQRVVDAKLHLRTHYRDKCLLSFGVEGWDPLRGVPSLLSLGTSYGHLTPEVHAIFNTYFIFNVQTKFLTNAKFFLQGRRENFLGRVEASLNRSLPESTTDGSPAVNQDVDVTVSFSNQYDSNTKYGGDLSYNTGKKEVNGNLAFSKKLDRVRVNGKVSSDRSMTMGLTSVYDDLTISFAGKYTLNRGTEQVEDKEVNKYWVGYKFGASLEFSRI